MSREHQRRSSEGDAANAGSETTGRDPRQMAMMKRARERKQAKEDTGQSSAACAEARGQIKNKVTHELKETCYGALDVVQSMVRADDRKDMIVDGSFGKIVAGKVVDFLSDKALDVAKDAFELGETIVAGPISTVFGAVKGQLESMAELDQKLRASEVVDKIVNLCRAAADRACAAAGATVDKISDEKMAEIAGLLDLFQNVKDDADGDAEGSLKHGLQNWVMEKLLGAPKTGGAAIHEEAVEIYEVYRAEVAKGEPAREQADDAQEVLSGAAHEHAEEEAGAAEDRLGLTKEVERDTHERERAKAIE